MTTGRAYLGSCGTQTAALGFGGYGPPTTAATEEYNGTSWTNNPTGLGTARYELAGAGTQTAGLGFGGYVSAPVGNTTATELWNGTSWTSNPTGLGSAIYGPTGSGTQASALSTGGYPAPLSTTSEEWTGSALTVRTITVS